MKKHLSAIALSLAVLSSATGYSQDKAKKIPCYTDEATNEILAKDPEARARYEKVQADFREELSKKENQQNSQNKTALVQYTIPVVFHILHQGGIENISDQACIDALDYMNRDLARTNPDYTMTAAPFFSLYVNSDIKLMLAKKDPNGNCTNGIVRHFDTKTKWQQGTAQFSDSYWSYTWNPTKYLNIYIVAEIVPQGTVAGGGIIVGYTYRPGSWPTGNPHDAIVYRYDFLDGSDARSLTHETGHWLNLKHIWGSTNAPDVACGNDDISDTPLTKGHEFNCPSSLSGNPCNGGGTDNVQNIMNYASCPVNFTQGQTTAMRTALESNVSGRASVISATNLAATGITVTAGCAPVAEFYSTNNTYTVCSGGAITMKSASYNGTISSYAWSATNGGVAANPSSSITAISFPSVGTAVVTLTVTNGAGSSTFNQTVYVLNGTQQVPGNYAEGFENLGTPMNWTVVNPDLGSITWEQTNVAAAEGGNSFFIDGENNFPGNVDYLQMPMLSPVNLPNNTVFTFKYAYARETANHNDKFEVQISTNCGSTWTTLMQLDANTMQSGSGGVDANQFIPSTNQWKMEDIYNHPLWFSYSTLPSVLIRFAFFEDPTAGFGNRFYLDDIVFAEPAGINDLTKTIGLNLYPNPSKGSADLRMTLSDAAEVSVEVVNILGQSVLPVINLNAQPGEQVIKVNANNELSKGVYFVNLSVNGTKMSRKLIIE